MEINVERSRRKKETVGGRDSGRIEEKGRINI